jgi:hypothetical protein
MALATVKVSKSIGGLFEMKYGIKTRGSPKACRRPCNRWLPGRVTLGCEGNYFELIERK